MEIFLLDTVEIEKGKVRLCYAFQVLDSLRI